MATFIIDLHEFESGLRVGGFCKKVRGIIRHLKTADVLADVYEVASYFGGIIFMQVGIRLALIAFSVTAAASIRAFTGGTGGGCCGS